MNRSFGLVALAASVMGVGGLIAYTRSLDPAPIFKTIDYKGAGASYRYTVYAPPRNHSDAPLPLVVFLHGTGEVGRDGKKHLKVGLAPFVYESAVQRRCPPRFVALFPQAQSIADWSPGSAETYLLFDYIEDVCRQYPIDQRRIYLTGHSIGANGVWALAAQYPHRWAALVPICGWSDPTVASRIAHIPVWIYQGARDDDPGLVENVREMTRALRRTGGTPRYTELPDDGHFIWPRVFSDPELFDWLLAQRTPER